MNYRDIDIFGYSFGGEVLKRIAEFGDDVREAYNRLVQAGYPSSTAEKIATGELPMDSASKAARMQEQGYTIPQFHGTYASDFTEVDPGMVDLGLHSGSFEQAVQRLRNTTDPLGGKSYGDFGYREGANVMPLMIKAENPLEMRDVGDWMNSVQVLEGMIGNPKLANRRNELEALYEEATELQSQFEGGDFLEESFRFSQDNRELLDYLKDMLREEGYDSVRYKNEVENAYGSQSALRPTAEQERRELSEQIRRLENTAMERAPQPPDPDDPLVKEKMREFLDAARSPSSYMTEDELARIESLKDRYREIGADPESYNDPFSYISLEEENVRSVNAAFDPDQRRNPNILAGLGATGVGAGLLFAPQESEASVLGEIGKRLVRNTSDASNIFGEGAEQITLSDPVSGGRIKLLSRPGEPNSVLSLYVDEEFRGQGVGKALQDAALAEGPLMGQVSSKAAAVNAYRSGRRPIGNPNASLEDVFAAIDEDSSVNMVTSDLLPSGKSALGAGAIGTAALAAPQDALAAEQGGAMDEIDIFEQFSQLSPEAEALLSRSAEGMVMTPGGPVRADAGPTVAQALNFAGLMTGLGGVVDLLGGYPQMPAEGVGFKEMLAGETNPSLLENLQEGNYLDTGLQLLSVFPLVGAVKPAAKGVPSLSRSVMPAPQRMFDPNDPAFKPFLKDFEYQPGGRYLEMGPGGPRDVSGEIPAAASISVDATGKPSMLISEDTLTSLPAPTRGRKVKANLFKKKAGWNWTQAPEGFDSNPPSSFPLVSVETGGRHFYSLKTDFPDGVELARYPQSKTEPRLRPTVTKGDVELGNVVGEISVRGKTHPVYDEVRVVAGMEPDPALRYLPQVGRPTFAPEVVQREGKDAFKELERMLKAHQNDLTTGADMVARAERINPGFQDRVREVSSLLGLEKVETSGVKSLKSIEEKLGRKPYGPEGITDPIRTRIYVNTVEEADEAARLIGERMPTLDGGFQMIPETGYFDRKLNVQYTSPEGEQLLGEIQLIPKPMSEAAETGHRMYEVARKLEERYGSATDIPMSHIRRFEEMQRKQRELYGAASEDIDESILRSIVPKFARGGYVGSSGRSSPMIPYSFWKDSSLKGLPSLKKSRTMRLFA